MKKMATGIRNKNKIYQNVSGIILAGGNASRFAGADKSKLMVNGEIIIERTVRILSGLFSEVIIVTNKPVEYCRFSDVRITGDIIANAGPLAGIHAAMHMSATEAMFVVAGDMPFIDSRFIDFMVNQFIKGQYDILVPRLGLMTEPLHAVYSTRLFEKLDHFLLSSDNKSVRGFYELAGAGYLDLEEGEFDKRMFYNINSEDDYEAIYK